MLDRELLRQYADSAGGVSDVAGVISERAGGHVFCAVVLPGRPSKLAIQIEATVADVAVDFCICIIFLQASMRQ